MGGSRGANQTIAVEQIKQYGQGKKVQLLTSGTQLHLIVAQIQGYEKKRVEEILL